MTLVALKAPLVSANEATPCCRGSVLLVISATAPVGVPVPPVTAPLMVIAVPCVKLVEEGVARSIREFDESKPLVRGKPLDDSVDWWTGRCLEPGLAEPGSGSESTRLWVGVSVEVATPRMTKILISQFGSWWVGARSVK